MVRDFQVNRRDPNFMFEFSGSPRKFEEFIAGAYRLADWDEVT